jgi:Zn-dependent protease
MAGCVVACPDCDAKLQVSAPSETASGRDTVYVRMTGHGKWLLFDLVSVPIVVDGRQVAQGSNKNGFDLVVKMAVGSHTVHIGPASHALDLASKGLYEVEFEFSKLWGIYSMPAKVRRVSAEESEDWPTAKDEVEPIELVVADGAILPQDEAVLAELERLQTQKPSWLGTSALLLISLLFYLGAARAQQIWESIAILIPVLFFHELGHYLTMRHFGYRNLRMFFIPFLGAAVSGQHYNIAGWKKAVVALAGPLPGVLLGSLLGVIGLFLGHRTIVEASNFMIIVNGFNLLPFLPLDGGWIVHAVLFVRHPVLDVIFRVLAALCLLGLAVLLNGWIIGALALVMLLTAPTSFRLARIAHNLKQEGLVARSVDNNSIPNEAALQILADLRRVLPPQSAPKVLAQHVTNVFEMFYAEPPGPFVSLGLLVLHAGGFVVALLMYIVVNVLPHRLV